MSTASTTVVELAIYDLSRGMARGLSAQFLGPDHALDMIPHTGIVVFGYEYFFGGGIQKENPQQFRQSTGMHPIRTVVLGRTSKTQAEWEAWCQSMHSSYNAGTYDLLHRNCNNFCHEAALQGLGLAQGVPQDILDVPKRFLSSPMGQMVRPMLENMQLSNGSGAHALIGAPMGPKTPQVPPTSNPWANMAPAETKCTAAESDQETPAIDSLRKPLLSDDTATVKLCVSKLIEKHPDQETALRQLETALWSKTTMEASLHESLLQFYSKDILSDTASPVLLYCLMLLRLQLLVCPIDSFTQVLDSLKKLVEKEGLSKACAAMVWLCVANWFGKGGSNAEWVDLAIRMGSSSETHVPQAVCAVLYNAVLNETAQSEELTDAQVSILCFSLENLSSVQDDVCRYRKLMAVARILKPKEGVANSGAASLIRDLGMDAELQALGQFKCDEKTSVLLQDIQKCLQ